MDRKNFFVLLFFCVSISAFAFEPSSVILTVRNESSFTFEFDKAKVTFDGNKVAIEPGILYPQQSATIKGTITKDYDLQAVLFFKDGSQFDIQDRRQFHNGQPVFLMRSEHVRSMITERTYNPVRKPRLLSFIAATIVLQDK